MAEYPLPAFHFQVDWGESNMGFSEVSGLSIDQQVIEYRDGLSPEYSTIKMPGIRKFGNITLKRGIMKKNNQFFDWLNKIKLNVAERRDMTVKLLDEEHNPVMVWSVKNAWPTKITSPTLKSDGNEVAIETIEVAHEGVTITNE